MMIWFPSQNYRFSYKMYISKEHIEIVWTHQFACLNGAVCTGRDRKGSICTHICVYIYICMCIYVHTYIYKFKNNEFCWKNGNQIVILLFTNSMNPWRYLHPLEQVPNGMLNITFIWDFWPQVIGPKPLAK
jgi:hypothetical protein